jgi:hypothetical protein
MIKYHFYAVNKLSIKPFILELIDNLKLLPYEEAHANAEYIEHNYMKFIKGKDFI